MEEPGSDTKLHQRLRDRAAEPAIDCVFLNRDDSLCLSSGTHKAFNVEWLDRMHTDDASRDSLGRQFVRGF